MLYPIIMAGGAGTRLWPISRKNKPKQVYPLIDEETLLQKTWKRLRGGFPANRIYVTTGTYLAEEVRKQLPSPGLRPPSPLGRGNTSNLPLPAGEGWGEGLNLILEPVRRGTAPALGLALLKVAKRDPKGIFVFVNADNFVRKDEEFLRLLGVARRVVQKKPDHTVLIGVNPTYPETGYGYIKMGSPVMNFDKDKIFAVEKFVEKPDLKTARKFLRRWEYLWNPTLIVARIDHFLGLYKKHLPQMWKQLQVIAEAQDTPREEAVVKKVFAKIKPETIDYGILEPACAGRKEKNMLVLPGNFGWTDVGHWRAVHEILVGQPDSRTAGQQKKNICKAGKCISVDSKGNFLYSLSGKLVALAGVKNMILIESENAILLCPKNRAQDVKKLVENLERKGLKEYL